MLQTLRQPKWLIAAVVVVAFAALFIRLGFWQLDRLQQRRAENQIAEMRLGADPQPLDTLLDEAGDDLESLEYRRVVVTGTFEPAEEILIRSQVELGQAGFHVVTPLVDDGTGVLVNRGWVPLALDQPPVEDAAPPSGVVEVDGWIHLTQTRPTLGPEDPPGDIDVFNRVDIARIDEQVPATLAPVYVVALEQGDSELPVVVDPPDFTDEGPHLAYAIQWFGFAAVGLIGFYFLLRRKGTRPTA
ncbi:MAG: SURF1 family protein [Acidimicrobiia bacterium]|jgi:surfeit locus 1 family protein